MIKHPYLLFLALKVRSTAALAAGPLAAYALQNG